MAAKAKIAVSLSAEVLDLLDRHARGRSRSQCVEQELLRALRAREWERLAARLAPDEANEQADWAEVAFGAAHSALAGGERATRRRGARRAGGR